MESKRVSIICIMVSIVFTMPCNVFARDLLNGSSDSAYILLQRYEDTLNILQYEKVKPQTSDAYKEKANQKFSALLKKALMLPGSFDYPFDSLKTISRLTSPDKKFRILNWDVPKYDETIAYYGYIQEYNAEKKTYSIYELHDKSAEIKSPEYEVGTPDNWLGMLYYKIIPEGREKDTYILLAWQGYSDLITHKVIDVISFNQKGVPVFGKSIFRKVPPGCRTSFKRIIFKYSAKVFMSLDYNAAKQMILFDHLGPPDPGLTGQYQFYGPSFQVDAMAYKDNRWEYLANVDARNPKSSLDKDYHPEKEDFRKPKKVIYSPSK